MCFRFVRNDFGSVACIRKIFQIMRLSLCLRVRLR